MITLLKIQNKLKFVYLSDKILIFIASHKSEDNLKETEASQKIGKPAETKIFEERGTYTLYLAVMRLHGFVNLPD